MTWGYNLMFAYGLLMWWLVVGVVRYNEGLHAFGISTRRIGCRTDGLVTMVLGSWLLMMVRFDADMRIYRSLYP
jgi:hypothetical protein